MNGGLEDWDCPAGIHSLAVNCDGRIQICPSLPPEELSVFDLTREGLQEILPLRLKRLSVCKKLCLATCEYNTAYASRHPLRFIHQAATTMSSI